MTVPAFINPAAGNAADARKALEGAAGIEIRETDPKDLAKAIDAAVRAGARRIIVAGGDGTVASAASVLAGTDVSLGILPSGTLNHLARDLRIPLDLSEAARLAASGQTATIDVGRAGDRIFINTSSIGAYVLFVRTRERLERRLGYWLATLAASVRIMFRLRQVAVELQAEGTGRTYQTTLLFVGIGERELRMPRFGGRVERGKRGLHIIVVETGSAARLLATAFAAVARGLESTARSPEVDAFLVDDCRIELPFSSVRVAVDGEIVEMSGRLEYSLWRDALRVVVPEETRLEKELGAGAGAK